jgi:hypothetical protein
MATKQLLTVGALLKQRLAYAVRRGYVQLQIITYTQSGRKTQTTVEAISHWMPLSTLGRNNLQFIRGCCIDANHAADRGHVDKANAAVMRAREFWVS